MPSIFESLSSSCRMRALRALSAVSSRIRRCNFVSWYPAGSIRAAKVRLSGRLEQRGRWTAATKAAAASAQLLSSIVSPSTISSFIPALSSPEELKT